MYTAIFNTCIASYTVLCVFIHSFDASSEKLHSLLQYIHFTQCPNFRLVVNMKTPLLKRKSKLFYNVLHECSIPHIFVGSTWSVFK